MNLLHQLAAKMESTIEQARGEDACWIHLNDIQGMWSEIKTQAGNFITGPCAL